MNYDNILLTLHIFGAGVVIGALVLAIVITLQKSLGNAGLKFYETVGRVIPPAIGVLLITGILLVAKEPSKFLGSNIFWAKMTLFVVDGFVAMGIINVKLGRAKSDAEKQAVEEESLNLRYLQLLLLIGIIILGVILASAQ